MQLDDNTSENVQSFLASREIKILTAGILWVFLGLNSEFYAEIGRERMFCKGPDMDRGPRVHEYEEIQQDVA